MLNKFKLQIHCFSDILYQQTIKYKEGVKLKQQYRLKDASNIYILAILVPLIVSFIISFVMSFIATIANADIQSLLSNMWVYAALLIITQGSFLAVVLIYNKVNKIKTMPATTLYKRINIWQILTVMVMSVCSLFLFLPTINMFDTFIRQIGYSNNGSLPFSINSWHSLVVALVVLALLPAVCEEMVFRGVIFNGFKNTVGVKKAVIFSALCFAIMHMSLQQTLYPFILGIILALIVYYTGSIKASILAHFINNAIVVITNFVASFSKNQPSADEVSFVFNATNVISAIFWLILGITVIFLCCKLLKRLKNTKAEKEQEEVQEINEFERNLALSELSEEQKQQLKNARLKTELKVFYFFLAITIFLWIVENLMYF